MNLTILANIVALAHAGALDSQALNAVCLVGHNTDDADLKWTLGLVHNATTQALAVALRPFGVTPNAAVPHCGDESTAECLARVYGPRTIGRAS